jgi:uncharacterized protein
MFEQSPILRWRKYNEKYLLQGNKCLKCNNVFYPQKYLCSCGSQDFAPYKFSGKGTLLTFTQINTPCQTFSQQAPYCIGIIELEEGPKITAQITDTKINDLKIGSKVEAVFRKIYQSSDQGIINYGFKFIQIEAEISKL